MPSAAAQAAYEEMERKRTGSQLPPEDINRILNIAAKAVKETSSNSTFFDEKMESRLPRFDINGLCILFSH